MDVGAVLDSLSEILGGDAPFAVVGGHALLAHGVHRATFDLDVLVRQRDQSRLVAALEEIGFETLHRSSGYSNHVHGDSSWGRLDVVYVDEESASRILDQCTWRSVAGRSVLIPSVKVLSAMKLHAASNDPSRRLMDLADIRALLEQAPSERGGVREVFLQRGRGDWLEDVGLEAARDGGSEDE